MKRETEIITVEAQCKDCRGTGIYHGFAEPKGVGVICLACDGSGKVEMSYRPFVRRKTRDDIQTVRLSRGALIAFGVGPTGSEISYKEFLEGKMPS